jgi:hypothetical protein
MYAGWFPVWNRPLLNSNASKRLKKSLTKSPTRQSGGDSPLLAAGSFGCSEFICIDPNIIYFYPIR